MKILVINSGSSSLKFQLLDTEKNILMCKGNCERIGIDGSFIKYSVGEKEVKKEISLTSHNDAINVVLSYITDAEIGVINNLSEINGVGHRVLHGAEEFTQSAIVTEDVLSKLKEFIPFGPLHMPANIMGIEAMQKLLPNVPQIAVFDTAFHSTLPKKAFMYAIPKKFYDNNKIRKFGFHGTSHKFVSRESAKFLNKSIEDIKIITCHLGNGSSISAVNKGKCVDTSMGFTPLEGMIMGTRSGDLDPSVHEAIMNITNMDIHELTNMLNKQSGLQGICGYSDMRDIESLLGKDDDVDLAFDMLCYRIIKYIGSYVAAMNGVDVITFTGGIGENTPELRKRVIDSLSFLGAKIDNNINENNKRGTNIILSTEDSKVAVLRIPTNEELEIALDTENLIKNIK